MARKLVVEIVGDSKNYERALQRSSKATKDFQSSVTKVNVGLSGMFAGGAKFGAGFFGTQGVIEAMRQSVKVASNLNEQISKSEAVFGDSSQAIQEWARSASKFGVANDQALEATGTFGNLFRTVDLGTDQAADMSRRLVELAADLAAFNNVEDINEVLEALRSGLIGEAEPLRRFGVLLSENRVQQQAMADTGKKNAKALTEQEKALGRYKIILEDTQPAHGNFAKTQKDLAQQTKTLKANLRDLQAELGGEVTPSLNDAATGTNFLVRELRKLDRATGGLGGKLFGTNIIDALKLGPERLVWQYRQLFGDIGEEAGVEFAKRFNFSATQQLTAGLQTAGLAAKDIIEQRGLGKPPPGFKATAEQRNAWFDARIARAMERAQSIGDLRKIVRDLEAELKLRKDITRRLTLRDEIWHTQQEILARQARNQAQAADAAKASREAAARAARLQLETQLGWLEFAVERAEATKTLKDDRKRMRAVEAYWKERIRQEGRTLENARELWRIQEKIRNLGKKNADLDPIAGLRQVSTKRLTAILAAGTGITPAGRRVLSANISGQQIQVYNRIELDGQAVAKSVTTHQARTSHRTGKQTSGRRG